LIKATARLHVVRAENEALQTIHSSHVVVIIAEQRGMKPLGSCRDATFSKQHFAHVAFGLADGKQQVDAEQRRTTQECQ
jgi:hypothetical protein